MNSLIKIGAFAFTFAIACGLGLAFGLTDVTVSDYFAGMWAAWSAAWPAFVGFIAGVFVMAERPSRLGWVLVAMLYVGGFGIYLVTFTSYVSWAWVGLGVLGAIIGIAIALLVAYPYARRTGLI